MLGDDRLLSDTQTKIGTTLITEVFGAGINHPALMKFFEFYHKRDYKEAYKIAKIFHERFPTREIIFVLFQSASLSLDYIQEKDILGRQVVAFLPASSKLGFLNHKADLIQARNLYKQGKSEEARERFKNILEQIGGYREDAIENILLYILDKFRVVSSYTYKEDDYNVLVYHMKVLIQLEPSMSLRNLRFDEITFNDINKSMFNCRLGLELAILSNVVAYYCSDIGNYKMAAKLYGAAWCLYITIQKWEW